MVGGGGAGIGPTGSAAPVVQNHHDRPIRTRTNDCKTSSKVLRTVHAGGGGALRTHKKQHGRRVRTCIDLMEAIRSHRWMIVFKHTR